MILGGHGKTLYFILILMTCRSVIMGGHGKTVVYTHTDDMSECDYGRAWKDCSLYPYR